MIPLVQIGQNFGGFRQNEIAVLEDRHIVLAGHLVHLRAHPSAVGHDDIVIGQSQIGQFLADYVTVRAPVDMIKRHSHDLIRLPGKGESETPFYGVCGARISRVEGHKGP